MAGPREAAVPTRRAAAALLALIMAAGQRGFEAENKHPNRPGGARTAVATLLETSNHVG